MLPSNNKTLHSLLTATGLMAEKAHLVESFTAGRSTSSKDMNDFEARELISYLRSKQTSGDITGANKMRRKIISMAHEMHWHLPGTQKVDMNRVNGWCINFGYGKKELNKYAYNELPKLVSQFEKMYSSFIKS